MQTFNEKCRYYIGVILVFKIVTLRIRNIYSNYSVDMILRYFKFS